MPAEFINKFSDRRAERRKKRDRKKALVAPRKRARRRVAAKVVVCIVVLALFALLALMVGDGDYHATPVGWIPFLTCVFAIVLAFLYMRVVKRTFHFSDAALDHECQRGETVRFTVHFENDSILFLFRVKAFFYVTDLYGNVARETQTTLALGPREKNDFGFNAVFDHIGEYTAGLEKVVITDFLGLFESTAENRTERKVRVLPRMHRIPDMQFANDAIVESSNPTHSVLADSMDYAYVRDYELGDPLKSIHWKLSARSDHYMTRLYEIQTSPGVVVIVDFYGPSDEAGVLMDMFDAVVESAFSVLSYAQEQGMEAELLFRNRQGETVRLAEWSEEKRGKIAGDMRQMTNDESEEAATVDMLRQEVTAASGQSNIVMCSASMDSVMLSTLAEAHSSRRAPMLISVVPKNVIERDRDEYCKPLARLDATDVPYIVISDADELSGEVRR